MTMERTRRLPWGTLAGVAFLVAFVSQNVGSISSGNANGFTYCLDDAYIHLSIAKNLVAHGVWGNTPYGFAGASSSPLWVLLLAADFLVQGPNTTIPLVLNLLFAIGSFALIGAQLQRLGWKQPAIFGALAALTLLVPLPPVLLSGMETSLQIFLVLAWFLVLRGIISHEGPASRRDAIQLSLLAALLTACRYEGVILVFVSCLLLLWRGSRVAAVAAGASAWAPIGAYGAFSILHGGHLFPNSVLAKAPAFHWSTARGVFDGLVGHGLVVLGGHLYLAALLGFALVAWWWLRRANAARDVQGLLFVFAGTLLLHVQVARVGWFYRYEAYLVFTGLLLVAWVLREALAQASSFRVPGWAGAVVLVVVLLPLTARALHGLSETVSAAKNIHDQQIQVGRLLGSSGGTRSVALFDIGGPSYFSETPILDYFGLGSLDALDWRRAHGPYDAAAVEALARKHGVELAVLDAHRMFKGIIPKSWILIGEWMAPLPNTILATNVVSFYVTNSKLAPEWRSRLKAFSESELPRDVPYHLAPEVVGSPALAAP